MALGVWRWAGATSPGSRYCTATEIVWPAVRSGTPGLSRRRMRRSAPRPGAMNSGLRWMSGSMSRQRQARACMAEALGLISGPGSIQGASRPAARQAGGVLLASRPDGGHLHAHGASSLGSRRGQSTAAAASARRAGSASGSGRCPARGSGAFSRSAVRRWCDSGGIGGAATADHRGLPRPVPEVVAPSALRARRRDAACSAPAPTRARAGVRSANRRFSASARVGPVVDAPVVVGRRAVDDLADLLAGQQRQRVDEDEPARCGRAASSAALTDRPCRRSWCRPGRPARGPRRTGAARSPCHGWCS